MTFRDPLGSERLTIIRVLNTKIDVAGRKFWGTQPSSWEEFDSSRQERQAVITQRNQRLSWGEIAKKSCGIFERCGFRYQKASWNWEGLWSNKKKINNKFMSLSRWRNTRLGRSRLQGPAEWESTWGVQLCREDLRSRADGSRSSSETFIKPSQQG